MRANATQRPITVRCTSPAAERSPVLCENGSGLSHNTGKTGAPRRAEPAERISRRWRPASARGFRPVGLEADQLFDVHLGRASTSAGRAPRVGVARQHVDPSDHAVCLTITTFVLIHGAGGRRSEVSKAYSEPLPLDGWPDVPTRFLLCTDDRCFPRLSGCAASCATASASSPTRCPPAAVRTCAARGRWPQPSASLPMKPLGARDRPTGSLRA